jgi:clan AA aspartic protease (TIGR02281 family)
VVGSAAIKSVAAMFSLRCGEHPLSLVAAPCRKCFQPFCDICLVPDDDGPYCVPCFREKRRRSRRRKVGAIVGAAVALAAGALAFSRPSASPPDDDAMAEPKRKLENELGKEPCDRPKMLELAKRLLQTGDNRSAINRVGAFFRQCGDDPSMRRLLMAAHERLSEWDLAAMEAGKLVDADPYRADYRAWRGLVYEQKGDWERAAEDYRQALALRPRLSDVPLNLAAAYERLGRPCEAAFPLELLMFHYPDRPMPGLRARVAELSAKGGCASSGSKAARIRYDPAARSIQAKTRVNGHATGVFVVDTGASFVTLSLAFADRSGIDLTSSSKVLLDTANGRSIGAFILLDAVAVEGLTALHVPAVVVEGLGPGVDGLLGLSFLSRFDLRQQNGVLEIAAKSAR